MTDPIREQIVHPAALDARDNRSHHVLYWAAGLIVVGGIALGALFLWGFLHDRDVESQLAGDVSILSQQVRSMGGTPKVSAPAGVPGATGAAGAQGDRGPQGDTGPSGPPGPTGPTGPGGTQGQPGSNGTNGGAGPSGSPGAAGAAGSTGATGPAGPSGVPGPSGAPGPTGQPGADGKPPAGWTWTDRLGTTYTCTRDASSPDSAPTYSCTATKGALP